MISQNNTNAYLTFTFRAATIKGTVLNSFGIGRRDTTFKIAKLLNKTLACGMKNLPVVP